MNYDKPFKTYSEQIELLKTKYGLNIVDEEFARNALISLSYYDLINGYKDCFMKNEHYIPNINIEFIYLFFLTDKSLQSILFKYSTIIENSFKSKLAYVLSKNIGVHENEYLDPKHYYKSYGKLLFNDFRNHCIDIYAGNKPIPQPTKHYKLNHNHIPPWILFKNVSFGNAINLIRLLKPNEQKELVDLLMPNINILYSEKVQFIISALNIIREYRNKIAHNLKFITFKPIKHQLSPNIITKILPKALLTWKDLNKKRIGTNDIYAYILCLNILLDDKYLQKLFCIEINNSFEPQNESTKESSEQILMHYFNITKLPKDINIRFSKYLDTL